MDRSPVFENFMNKMATMQGQGKPKISATSMKIGSGGLEVRVANNEKKITLLKNIFKAQRQEIGEKITPQVSNLEQSLLETTSILGEITQKLQLDYSQRLEDQKKLFNQQRKDNLKDKRDAKEERLEDKKKGKITKKLANTIIKPFSNIFDKLFNLVGILGAGILGTNFLKRLDDPEFLKRIKGIYDWTTKNWKAIAIGAGIIGTILAAGAIANFISGASLVFGILTNPVFLAVAGVIALSFLFKKGDQVKQDLTRTSLTNFAEENNILDDKLQKEINNVADLQRIDQPFNTFENVLGKNYSGGVEFNSGLGLGNFSPTDSVGDAMYSDLLRRILFKKNNNTDLIKPAGNTINENNLKNLVLDQGGETFIELPDIDLTKPKLNKIGGTSGDSIHGISRISSMNAGNSYMVETPQIFGFADVIYD